MSATRRAWMWMAGVALVILAADQATKAIVEGSLVPGEAREIFAGVDLVRVTNEGIAFGFLENGGAAVIAVTAISLLAVLGWFAFSADRPYLWLGIGLLLGGAFGNLVDRVRASGVTDFIDPPLWPAFNLADVAITIGVVVLVFSAFAPVRDDPAAR